jgi:hypothetical protein
MTPILFSIVIVAPSGADNSKEQNAGATDMLASIGLPCVSRASCETIPFAMRTFNRRAIRSADLRWMNAR